MIMEKRSCWQNGLQDGDYPTIITNLCNDKLKLLKEQKTLYLLLADKEEQILRMSELYRTKWETVCDHLKNIDHLCNNNEDLSHLKMSTSELLKIVSPPIMHMDSSISSYFTATDTVDSTVEYTVSTSSESIVAKQNTDTLTKFSGFQSLNSLDNEVKPEKKQYQHVGVDEQSFRTHSDCVHENNDFMVGRFEVESDTSESLFRVPENHVRRSKKLTKKASNKSDKSHVKIESILDCNKSISELTNPEVYSWLLNVARLPKVLFEDIKMKNKINASNLEQVTEHKFDKLFGTNDKLIKKKVLTALEEYKYPDSRNLLDSGDLSSKDHNWVANVWLKKHVGLSHLSAAFLSRCIDGRLLKSIAKTSHSRMKELLHLASTNFDSAATPLVNVNKTVHEPSKSDIRSLRFGLELFIKFDFNLKELETRRTACEELNKDVLVWTNERFAKWFHSQNLKNYIRGIEYSGFHGAMMVLDPQFSVSTIAKQIQIPSEVVKKNNLDEKMSTLLKPSRFNEGVKSRRSTSIFRRRSLSQPRYVKPLVSNHKTSNVTPDVSDITSNNGSATLTMGIRPVEKSHTIDLSHSPSRNQNFVRTYRKPEHLQPKISVTDIDTDGDFPRSHVPPSHHSSKSPPWKLSSPFPLQIVRKLRPRSDSGSDNESDYEV